MTGSQRSDDPVRGEGRGRSRRQGGAPRKSPAYLGWNSQHENAALGGSMRHYSSMMRDREGRFAGRGPKGYRRSDQRILEEVSDRLTDEAGVDASEIEVEVEEGVVTLSGEARSRRAKRRTEDCISDVRVVRDVSNRLRLRRS